MANSHRVKFDAYFATAGCKLFHFKQKPFQHEKILTECFMVIKKMDYLSMLLTRNITNTLMKISH